MTEWKYGSEYVHYAPNHKHSFNSRKKYYVHQHLRCDENDKSININDKSINIKGILRAPWR